MALTVCVMLGLLGITALSVVVYSSYMVLSFYFHAWFSLVLKTIHSFTPYLISIVALFHRVCDLTEHHRTVPMSINGAASQYRLGLAYQYGMKQQQIDKVEAYVWYKKAAEQGFGKAQERVGGYYEQGRVGPQPDCDAARVWYERAAAQNEPSAMYMLALLKQRGEGGFAKDKEGARADVMKLLPKMRAEAENGDVVAQLLLAGIYASSAWNVKDNKQCVYWYRRAAKQGCAAAQDWLGDFYLHGHCGLPKDRFMAIEWYEQAAASGFQASKDSLFSLVARDKSSGSSDRMPLVG
mgnify:CR=1 FL=1